MTPPKKQQIAILVAVAASVIGFSVFAFTGFANSQTADDASDDIGNAYLEPCGETCIASEQDYENLTTFELLAIYPELSEDPLGNDTSISSEDEIDESAESTANNTKTIVSAPIGNNTASNQTNTGNSTGNFTIGQ